MVEAGIVGEILELICVYNSGLLGVFVLSGLEVL